MKESIIINPSNLSGRLTLKTIQVLKILQKKCVTPAFVDYGEIANQLKTSRNSIKYSVKTLEKYGIIIINNEKIEIIKRLVL